MTIITPSKLADIQILQRKLYYGDLYANPLRHTDFRPWMSHSTDHQNLHFTGNVIYLRRPGVWWRSPYFTSCL